MSVEQFSNNPQTTLNGSITNSQITITVSSNSGFPTSAQFRIIIDSEIMLVTAGMGGLTWTVTRGNNLSAPDTTTNTTHANLATVTHVLTAGGLTGFVSNPVSGATWANNVLLTLASNANSYGLQINGPSGAGTSLGALIKAGTNSTDFSARFQTQAAADIMQLRGDGVVVIGGNPSQVNMTGTGQAKIVGGTTGGVITNNANSGNNFSWNDAGLVTLRNGLLIPRDAANNVLAPNSAYATVAVKIDDQLLAAPAASITFSPNPLPTTFRHLVIEWYARGDTVATNTAINVKFNNDSTAANYEYQQFKGSGATSTAAEALNTIPALALIPAASATASYFGQGEAKIRHYQSTVGNKVISAFDGSWTGTGSGAGTAQLFVGAWKTTATAITRIDLTAGAGNFVTGSLFTLWGIP